MRRPHLLMVAELDQPLKHTPIHRFDSWVMIWYPRGHGSATFPDEDPALVVPIRPGVVLCIPPGMRYCEQSRDGFISLWVCAEGLPFPLDAPNVFDVGEDRRFGHGAHLLLEEYRMRRANWQEACAGQLSTVLRLLRQVRGERSGNALIDHLVELMRIHAHDPAFTAASAMRRIGASPAHLRRLFRQALGSTPTRHLHELRIGNARNLLRLSDLSIAEIALRSGFDDQFYFSRVFRQVMGVGPRDFRDAGAGAVSR